MFFGFSVLKDWWQTWHTLPVIDWVIAASHYKKQQYELSAAYYQKGLEKKKNHPAAQFARLDLGFCLFRVGKFRDAEEQFQIVISARPTLREGYIRLARLQAWNGKGLEAAWTMRRALKNVKIDSEIVALYLSSLLDFAGPEYMFKEALSALSKLSDEEKKDPKLVVAIAKYEIMRGDFDRGRSILEEEATENSKLFEAVLLYAEILLAEGKIAQSRRQLRRALKASPHHPQVNCVFAETYLYDGAFYNPEFAVQLATVACQSTGWLSPRAMHVLAESFRHSGEKITALIMASKAKDTGSRLMGKYKDELILDKLIERLSSGTQY